MFRARSCRSRKRDASPASAQLLRARAQENVGKKTNFYPVILAGGRGTRFWPISRKRKAKQLLALDGSQTMIQQAVARLRPMASPRQFWVVTNQDLRRPIAQQLPGLDGRQILAEPVGRN